MAPWMPASTAGIYSLGMNRRRYLVDELIALAGLIGLHGDADVAVLALTAGLAGILGVLLHRLLDGLLVGDLGCAHVGLHLELAEQTVDDDLQVELAHAGDDGLTGLLVGVGREGGVLFSQLHQRQAHLLLAGLGLGLDGHADDGSGNSMDSRMMGCLSSHRVSPVVVFFRPTAAAMSPE